MRTRCAAAMCIALCLATRAHGQSPPDFSNLRVTIGDTIFVTSAASGVEIAGPVTEVSPTALKIDSHLFTPGEGLKIQRAGDSLWNGTRNGFLVGLVAGVTIGAEACSDSPRWHCAVGGGVTWAAIGALIDWLHKGRTTIYDTSAVRH